ncbi:MAG: pyridoxal phosphate-dependent aminotransferase [Desulfurococcales archaeon]|nr:pyridoxal phosphate-dependent aminotransferase [Desulfurococcales archaeon]
MEPPPWSLLEELGVGLDLGSVDLGYGWTKGSPRLREAVADWLGGVVDAESVVVTAGSAEANLVSVLALVAPGDTVLVDMPNYMQVPGLLRLRGARVVEVWRRPEESWRLPVWSLVGLIREARPRVVFATNPNNPTGAVERGGLWEVAQAAAEAGAVLVFDEVYRGLELEGGLTPSVLEAAAEAGAEAVAVGGLSKAFGLPGLRIGWAAATSRRLADRLWAVKDYTTISPPRLGEAVAVQVLQPSVRGRLLELNRAIVVAGLEALREALAGLPVRVCEPSAGAFALVDVDGVEDTMGLAEGLLERGILVNPGECFGVQGYLRVATGLRGRARAREAYRRLATALRGSLLGES